MFITLEVEWEGKMYRQQKNIVGLLETSCLLFLLLTGEICKRIASINLIIQFLSSLV